MTTAPTEILTASELTTNLGATAATNFVDRRNIDQRSGGFERRQFANSHATLSPDARELAEAIDAYKVQHRRRYITFEEMLKVIHSLGYQK
jgi:hypothetical protein